MARPEGYWRTLPIDNNWLQERSAELTAGLLAKIVELRGLPSVEQFVSSTTSIGYLDELKSWTLGAHTIHGDCYAVRAWRPGGGRWLFLGWGRTRHIEEIGNPVGRIFDLAWVLDHIDKTNRGDGWLWVTAGEWDCIMLRCFGWLATTSCFGESSKPAPDMLLREFGGVEHAQTLLNHLRGIVVVFDVDDAGRTGTVQFVDAFERMIGEFGLLLPNWQGVRAIDLRQLPGWGESGADGGKGDAECGWDVSNLVSWAGKHGGVDGVLVAGRALRQAAANAGSGADVARELLGVAIDENINSRINLNDSMVGGKKLHTIEWADLLEFCVASALRYGSRSQGTYHMALLASRNGWLYNELVGEDEARLAEVQRLLGDRVPKDSLYPLGDIRRNFKRPFLDFQTQDNLCTDRANVQRLSHYYSFFALHPARGVLYWDGVRWCDGEAKLADHIQRLPDYIEEESNAAYQAGQSGVGNSLRGWAKRSQQIGRMQSTLSWVKKTTSFALSEELGEHWDSDGMVLAGPRGVVELGTGRLLTGRHARDKHCSLSSRGTILLGAAGVEAWGWAWEHCNKFWQATLEQWQPGQSGADVLLMLQELAGMALRGQLDEMLIVLQGSGRSGKSAFLQGLSWALGDYAMEVPGEVVTRGARGVSSNFRTSSLAQMDHKRMIKISEVGGKTLDVDMIKQITGENTVTGRLMFHNPIETAMTHTAFMMTNRELDLRGEISEAVRGRLWLVPFDTTFVTAARLGDDSYRVGLVEGSVREARDDIKSRLMGLVAGFEAMPDVVLTWAHAGLLRVMERGALVVPDVVRAKTNGMWATSDVLGEYWSESGLWIGLAAGSGTEGTVVATSWLYNNVRSWAEQWDSELVERIGTKQQFAELLKSMAARGFEKLRSSHALGSAGKQTNAWKVPYKYAGPRDGV